MAYYYVKDDGTAESGTATGDGGRYTTAKTGDWSTAFTATTEYYASIGAAIAATTTPTDGDYILVSDLHNKSYDNTTDVLLNSSGSPSGAGLYIISVDDTACDEYKPGAYEHLSDTTDNFRFYNNGMVAGVDLETGDDVIYIGSGWNARVWTFQDLELTVDGNLDFIIKNLAPGIFLRWINVDINANATNINGGILKSQSGTLEWNGGAITAGDGDIDIELFSGDDISQGMMHFLCNGVDLTNLNSASLTPPPLSSLNDDFVIFRYTSCKISANATLPTAGTDLFLPQHRFEMFNCDDATGGALHRFHIVCGSGTAQNNDSVYVTANPAFFEGSNKSSIKVTTTSSCSHLRPFIFDIPARYVDFGDTGSDVVYVNIVTDFTLTNCDIAFFLVYPDGTTPVQPNWIASGKSVGTGNYGTDPLAALMSNDAELNTTGALGASDWTGEPTSPNFYKVQLDTSGDAGEAFFAALRCEVYKASISGTTGGYLFIDPVLGVE